MLEALGLSRRRPAGRAGDRGRAACSTRSPTLPPQRTSWSCATGLAARPVARRSTSSSCGPITGRKAYTGRVRSRVTTPYWLDEPAHGAAAAGRSTVARTSTSSAAGSPAAHARSRSPRQGCACASYDGARVAEGASGRNGGFALRGGGDAVRRARRARSAREAAARSGADRGGARRMSSSPAMPSGGSAACGSPPTSRSARSSAPSTKRCARTASRPSGSRPHRALAGRFPAAIFHPDRRRAAARAVGAASRRARRSRPGSRSSSTTASIPRELEADRSSSRPTDTRAGCSASSKG